MRVRYLAILLVMLSAPSIAIPLAAAGDDDWTVETSRLDLRTDVDLNGVALVRGVFSSSEETGFAAVGSNGTVLYVPSVDVNKGKIGHGIVNISPNWTGDLNAVAGGRHSSSLSSGDRGSVWAVGDGGFLGRVSETGVARVPLNTTEDLVDVAYDDGRVVAVGANGTVVLYDEDKGNATVMRLPRGPNLLAVDVSGVRVRVAGDDYAADIVDGEVFPLGIDLTEPVRDLYLTGRGDEGYIASRGVVRYENGRTAPVLGEDAGILALSVESPTSGSPWVFAVSADRFFFDVEGGKGSRGVEGARALSAPFKKASYDIDRGDVRGLYLYVVGAGGAVTIVRMERSGNPIFGDTCFLGMLIMLCGVIPSCLICGLTLAGAAIGVGFAIYIAEDTDRRAITKNRSLFITLELVAAGLSLIGMGSIGMIMAVVVLAIYLGMRDDLQKRSAGDGAAPAAPAASGRVCPACRQPAAPADRFCVWCGTSLAEGETASRAEGASVTKEVERKAPAGPGERPRLIGEDDLSDDRAEGGKGEEEPERASEVKKAPRGRKRKRPPRLLGVEGEEGAAKKGGSASGRLGCGPMGEGSRGG